MDRLIGENLSFRYGDRLVVDNVTIAVTAGRAAALVGASGAGKTTLLWLLAGLHRPLEGQRSIAGSAEPIGPMGMVFQQPGLWDHLTVAEHLELVLTGKGLSRADRRRRLSATLSQMGLTDLGRRRPGQLSGGERQRVAIARALVIRPRWLLLDEPLAHLDGAAREGLFALLSAALSETGAGVLLATHNTTEAMRVADDVVVMIDGRIAQRGPTQQVYESPVDLQAACVLGPAGQLTGIADSGSLIADSRPVLEGIDPSLTGPQQLILRPRTLRFFADPAGPATVVRCEFTGGEHQLEVTVGNDSIPVLCTTPLLPGTTGRLHVIRSVERGKPHGKQQ